MLSPAVMKHSYPLVPDSVRLWGVDSEPGGLVRYVKHEGDGRNQKQAEPEDGTGRQQQHLQHREIEHFSEHFPTYSMHHSNWYLV